jgi:hypothetical protein
MTALPRRANVSACDVLPDLVRVDHEYRTGWSCLLADKALRRRRRAAGALFRVVDDGADEGKSSLVHGDICADLHLEAEDPLSKIVLVCAPNTGVAHLEVVEALRDSLPSEAGNLLIRIAKPAPRVVR